MSTFSKGAAFGAAIAALVFAYAEAQTTKPLRWAICPVCLQPGECEGSSDRYGHSHRNKPLSAQDHVGSWSHSCHWLAGHEDGVPSRCLR
jgi:hypothetical protein